MEKCKICNCRLDVKVIQVENRINKDGICDYCFYAGRADNLKGMNATN